MHRCGSSVQSAEWMCGLRCGSGSQSARSWYYSSFSSCQGPLGRCCLVATAQQSHVFSTASNIISRNLHFLFPSHPRTPQIESGNMGKPPREALQSSASSGLPRARCGANLCRPGKPPQDWPLIVWRFSQVTELSEVPRLVSLILCILHYSG
jgi:hypothetical protein